MLQDKTINENKIGAGYSFDNEIWGEIEQLIQSNEISTREIVEDFAIYLRRVNLAKFITHIELFQKTINLPGSIVECGVFKGMSFMTFLKLADILCPGDTLKKVIGFDTFEGFVSLNSQDGEVDEKRNKVVGGWNAGYFYEVLNSAINISQKDSFIPRFKRVELVKGDVCKTVPEYVEKNPGLRISLLHLDMDLYEPTLTALEYFYPRVVTGGVILLDEYAMRDFPGESSAVDKYFKGNPPLIKKFPYTSTPGGYFIKGQ